MGFCYLIPPWNLWICPMCVMITMYMCGGVRQVGNELSNMPVAFVLFSTTSLHFSCCQHARMKQSSKAMPHDYICFCSLVKPQLRIVVHVCFFLYFCWPLRCLSIPSRVCRVFPNIWMSRRRNHSQQIFVQWGLPIGGECVCAWLAQIHLIFLCMCDVCAHLAQGSTGVLSETSDSSNLIVSRGRQVTAEAHNVCMKIYGRLELPRHHTYMSTGNACICERNACICEQAGQGRYPHT